MSDDEEKQFMSVKDAAVFLGVHPETIRRLLRDEKLKGKMTFSRRWKVDRDFLTEFRKNYRPE